MVLVCLAVTFLSLLTPGSAEDASGPPGGDEPAGSQPIPPIVWTRSRFENVREGYQSLTWEPLPIEADVTYEVVDESDNVFYRGGLPEAFISGLPDGEHTFEVRAWTTNAYGDVVLIAASDTPAVVLVDHWPMSQAWILLGVGAIVFGILIGLIVIGDRMVRAETVS
ncbi:hypothetical protein Pla100_40230 [Neorhodopirellula pilleata]|uniref:Fibronectin type-III domain-containing protein n=2 Tax=Neorhodopirellula pilleata TaxID=2714738 RepID=A0A5C6A274_9BACT|nr:hypothetical protein Pla100_40230 [Neorhodopirellula pilleata]